VHFNRKDYLLSKTAVVLLNLGGPDSLESVEPFLYNLFCDPDIFKLPFGQKIFAKLISNRRAPKVIEEYKLIGGKSPINEWTEIQRKKLEIEIKKIDPRADVFIAMRYWHPLTGATIKKIESGNYEKIILLPLYPHYSTTTTGSSFNEWNRKYNGDRSNLVFINSYHVEPAYISAINQRVDEALLEFPENVRNEVQLVFSAHGTPVSLVKKGDPYSNHIKETIEAVMKQRNNSLEHYLCYQSKVGPMKWLEPATDTMIEDLVSKGKKHLLIIPISFVSDHIETLFELDIEYRHIAEKCGVENYIVMKGLNDSALFINGLRDLIKNQL
jgi:ferrochelatase